MSEHQKQLLINLYQALTALLLEGHISDDLDEAVENLHDMIVEKNFF